MELFDRLDAARERWNVLDHPFYRRWSAGVLTRGELGFYAGEYRHAVVALADQSAACAREADARARPELERHAAEERAHIGLWDDFAGAVGAASDGPLQETLECARAWTVGEGLVERLSTLYAIEASQPAISQTKLEGLVAHHGIVREEAAAAYFVLHAVRDRDHAAQARRLLAERLDQRNSVAAATVAERALEANWRLLDGVEERTG